MDLELAHGRAQQVLRQRNALGFISLGLALALSVVGWVALTRDREVILVPTLRTPVTLTSAAVSPDYLQMVTRDVALVALNRAPDALPYWMNSILAFTDERARGAVKADLMKIVAEQQGSQITQFFTPDSLTLDTKKLESQVGGTVHTVVASKEVTSAHRTFRFSWAYNGVSLKLIGFGMVQTQEPAK